MRLRALFVIASCTLAAQDTGFRTPTLGFVLDESRRALRAIHGTPGAATLGPAVSVEPPAFQASIHSEGKFALTLDESRTRLAVLTGLGEAELSTVFAREFAAPVDKLALSPRGESAAVYAGGAILLLKGLRSASVEPFEVTVEGMGVLTAIAVNDEGVLIGVSAEGEAAVLAPVRKSLGTFLRVSALAFSYTGGDILVGDSGSNTVYRVRDVLDAAELAIAAPPEAGIDGPIAVAAARDGSRIYVANSGTNTITVVGETAAALPCACRIDQFTPLAIESLFQITHAGKGPVWLLEDISGAPPRLRFVPAQQEQVDE